MRRTPASIVAAACVMALGSSGCAHARRPVVLEPAASASKSRLADLPPMPGAHVVVLLRSGATAKGVVETMDESVLVLRPNEPGSIARRVPEDEIVCLARRVGKSTTARGWLGALIGAAASLPFGVSMVGDMMMPAAIVGALIAGNTGQPRARSSSGPKPACLERAGVSKLPCRHTRLTPGEPSSGSCRTRFRSFDSVRSEPGLIHSR